MPWPTLTRRLQFYIDHELYMELGEELPVHKDNPPIGGNYPLQLISGHTRWSIHSIWQDEENLMRLQRGEPTMVMSPGDLAARGLRDGDLARARNDIGWFEARVKVSPSVRPGEVILYHGWEPYQFKGHRSHQTILPAPSTPSSSRGATSICSRSCSAASRGTTIAGRGWRWSRSGLPGREREADEGKRWLFAA